MDSDKLCKQLENWRGKLRILGDDAEWTVEYDNNIGDYVSILKRVYTKSTSFVVPKLINRVGAWCFQTDQAPNLKKLTLEEGVKGFYYTTFENRIQLDLPNSLEECDARSISSVKVNNIDLRKTQLLHFYVPGWSDRDYNLIENSSITRLATNMYNQNENDYTIKDCGIQTLDFYDTTKETKSNIEKVLDDGKMNVMYLDAIFNAILGIGYSYSFNLEGTVCYSFKTTGIATINYYLDGRLRAIYSMYKPETQLIELENKGDYSLYKPKMQLTEIGNEGV